MALIKFGPAIAGISGKIGGVVFSHNRYGAYMRNLTTPVNPNTNRQSNARARVSLLASRWNEVLTTAQRTAWNDYASQVTVKNKVGDDVYTTGFNHYIRSNSAILACGGTIVDAAPVTLLLPETDPTFAIAGSEATQLLTITFDDTADMYDEDGAYLSIQLGLPKNTEVNYFGGPWRWAAAIEGDSVTPPSTGATIAVPFAIAEDQKLFCQARIIRADGRVSNFFRSSVICGA